MEVRQAKGNEDWLVDSLLAGNLSDALERFAGLARQVWAQGSPNLRRLEGLRLRLRERSLNVAVLGQFKRGKSTFLNALLGKAVLPTGIVPLTAVPTFVAWGEEPVVRVTYDGGQKAEEFLALHSEEISRRLFEYVAEEANPKNRLQVARVDLLYPTALLRHGVTLIDTPGIGSTLRHNTETALSLLPDCDAAVFVTSADPPITEAELGYLETVRGKVARVIFVLNKVDLLNDGEVRSATQYLRRTLESAPSDFGEPRIFCLSSLKGLNAKQTCDRAALLQSGLPALEAYLQQNLVGEKLAALDEAVVKKCDALLAEAVADADLRLRALEMPIEELRHRCDAFQDALGSIEAEKRTIHDLLVGENRRAVERLEARAQELRQAGQRHLWAALEKMLSEDRQGEGDLPAPIGATIEEFFSSRLRDISRQLGLEIDETVVAYHRRIDALVNRVRRAAADLFEIAYMPAAASEPFRLGRDPYWVSQGWSGHLVPSPRGLLAGFLRGKARRAAVEHRFRERIAELVDRNVENLRWAALQGLDRTFRHVGAELDERLAMTLQATRGATSAAIDRRQSAASEAAAELAQLRQVKTQLMQLQAERRAHPAGPLLAPLDDTRLGEA